MTNTVVVIGGNYTSRLGVSRAVGMTGEKVIVIKTESGTGTKKCMIDASSKYVNEYYCVPEPDQEGLISLLLTKIKSEQEKIVLIPTDDYTAATIDIYYDKLKPYFLMPNIGDMPGKVVCYMDKERQKKLAAQVGLTVPKYWTAIYKNDSYIIPDGVVYPCFTKSQTSIYGGKSFMKKINSEEELKKHLGDIAVRCQFPVLIEQYIDVEKEYAIPGFTNGKDVFIPGVIEKKVIYLGVTATGVMRQRSVMEEVAKNIENLIKDIGFVGLIDIELYESKGIIYFNELNLRFGANGYAATSTFGNLPVCLIKFLRTGYTDAQDIKWTFLSKKFASEKVCLQYCRDSKSFWHDYKNILDGADFYFVKNEDDTKPYKYLCISIYISRLKKLVKRIIHK
jgi:predicted ATP-grasp superfamily ATP-dependent carboligase